MLLFWWYDWGLFYLVSYLFENVVVWWIIVVNFYCYLIKFKCRFIGILCYLVFFRIFLIIESFDFII